LISANHTFDEVPLFSVPMILLTVTIIVLT
jgi:hypothetical protein